MEAAGSIPAESIMESDFAEFVKLARKTLAECPWASLQTVEDYSKQVASEAKEVMAAVEKKDYENLKEELGDLFWDTLMVMLIAEKEGLFRHNEPLLELIEKMRRRKPFLFTGQKVTLEEAERMWSEAKAREKKR